MVAPEFSVVIPTRERVPFLARALASVFDQSLADVEIIVVDDGQGEGEAYARLLDRRNIVTLRTGGAGQVPARNRAIAAASGRRIAFLDDDDWWADANHLRRLAFGWTRPCLRYASGLIVQESAAMEPIEAIPFHSRVDATSICHDNTLLVSAIAFDRSLVDAVGPFDEALPYYWDWDFYLRLFALGAPFEPVEHDGVRISTRAGTVSADANEVARRADLAKLAAKHGLGAVELKNHETIALARRDATERR